jgi:hypothetical protein
MAQNGDDPIKVNCIEVQQPIGTFYIGAIQASDLVTISFADVRRPEGREIERYIGTQRDLSPARVADIKKYVTTVDACFPTSVILAIPSSEAKLDDSRTILEITRRSTAFFRCDSAGDRSTGRVRPRPCNGTHPLLSGSGNRADCARCRRLDNGGAEVTS